MFDSIELTNNSLSNLKKAVDAFGAAFPKECDLSKESDFFKKSWKALEKQ